MSAKLFFSKDRQVVPLAGIVALFAVLLAHATEI